MFPVDPIAAVTHPDPYAYYADLVARKPLYWDEPLGLWVAAGADVVTAVLSNPNCRVRPPIEPVPHALLGSPAAEIFGALVRMTDGARHCPLKRAISATFESIDLAAAAALGRVWAQKLVEELRPQQDRGQLAEVAFRLPVYVVGDLLGVPQSRLAQLARWTSDLVRCLAPSSTAEQVEHGKLAAGHLRDEVQALLVAQQPGRRDSLLTALVEQARRAGCEEDNIILGNAIGFLSQAYEATAGLAGNTLMTLAVRPDLYTQVLEDLALLEQVISEVSRYDPPIQNTRRFLAEDAVVAGQAMRAGDVVLVVLAAANRDPWANPHPERFEVFRTDRLSFTFGAGAHACPGAVLAGAIARAGVAQLIADGLDLMGLAETATYRASANARIPLWQQKEPIS
jgi:cytochrome P450